MSQAAIKLEHNAFGQLVFIGDDGAAHPVTPVRSVPIAALTEGIGLVNGEGDELAWVERIDAAHLGFVEPPVGAFALHQLVVRAHFDHAATVHHHQAVGFAQGGQAVGDGDGGAAQHEVVQGFLDFLLGLGVHG